MATKAYYPIEEIGKWQAGILKDKIYYRSSILWK